MLKPQDAFILFLLRYKNFSGRSRRSEYWWATILSFLIVITLFGLDMLIISSDFRDEIWSTNSGFFKSIINEFRTTPLSTIASFVFIVPLTTVGIRRMHDVGRSGWWYGVPTILSFLQLPQIFPSWLMKSFGANLGLILLVIGLIVLMFCLLAPIYFTLQDSQYHSNKYGPPEKERPDL